LPVGVVAFVVSDDGLAGKRPVCRLVVSRHLVRLSDISLAISRAAVLPWRLELEVQS